MCVLEKDDSVYLGFGANFNILHATNHAIDEAVHTYRGEQWFKLLGEEIPNYAKDIKKKYKSDIRREGYKY